MRLELESKKSATEPKSKQNPFVHHSEPDQVGVALVGLGDFSLATILPVFEWCENARLSALVSGNQEKALKIAREHDIPRHSIYSFQDFDRIKNNREVQIVYISLRGPLRDQMILRAARAGKHIICEGRFSGDAKIDQQIAQACDEAGVKLLMTYRKPGVGDGLTVLKLEHMANCVLRNRTPLRLSEVLRGAEAIRVDVSRWAN